jgi:hypothetical protein
LGSERANDHYASNEQQSDTHGKLQRWSLFSALVPGER